MCSRTRSASPATRDTDAARDERARRSCFAATRSSTSQRARRRCSRTSDDLFRVTSIRKGFVGGGLEGEPGLPKQMALAAGIQGAELIPDGAQLFLGFTSTQRSGLGPSRIANLETLGYADLGPSGYFVHGTHMHLSHLFEDVAAWYQIFDFQERLDTTFRPGLDVPRETQTVAQGVSEAQTEEHVRRDFARHRRIGHAGSVQPASRLDRDVDRARRHAVPEGNRGSAARGLQHPRQPVLLVRRSEPATRSWRSLPPASTSSSSTRRATTSVVRGSRWTEFCPGGRVSSSRREAAAGASTRSWRRRIGRTSSSPLAHTARSLCPSFLRSPARRTNDIT